METTRRGFLATSSAAAALSVARANDEDPILKIGLVGCGERGTRAAVEALRADKRVELTAMADLFKDKLDAGLKHIRGSVADKVRVPAERCFLGFDAYERVLASGVDVVLLATPPAFRPRHLAAAVAAGKHSFCESPAAIDAPGIRSFMKSAELAGQKKLGILSGFCFRYNAAYRAAREQIAKGALGDIRAIYATHYQPSQSLRHGGKRRPEWSELEWQLRDWADYLWLSGDQSILLSGGHSVDKISWWLNDAMPQKAVATGGKQCAGEGNTFDHAHVIFEYASGVRAFLGVRSQDGCHDENNDYILGTKGICTIGRGPVPVITGEKPWRFAGQPNNMYQTQHDEFFASIRAGRPLNDGPRMANTTLMAILGRMAAYTGQEVTWQIALNSKESLAPEKFDWKMAVPNHAVAVPGRTKLV